MKSSKCYKYLNIRYISFLCIGFTLLNGSGKTFASAPTVHPIVIEIVGKPGLNLNSKLLLNVCKLGGIPSSLVYQWNNHLVLFGDLPDSVKLLKQLRGKYSNCTVKTYARPFYNFNRKYCSGSATAKEWDNIILTADLVADLKMQQEYLNYHATQFQKWPEISKGFCNASFQQLLVYKNGRQLMLIISIPKGESLDKLNPLTTKNNPRVDDWNKIMKKYQTGIPGTKQGEVWVFLKPLGK